MPARLYAVSGSHPAFAAGLMLDRKGIEYTRVDLPLWFHRPLLRALRFPGSTVPALVLDGRRVQTTRKIARALDAVRPEPPLVPADPARRARVESVETWCDEVLQQLARRLVYWALRRRPSAIGSFVEAAPLVLPRALVMPLAPAIVRILGGHHRSTDAAVAGDLAALPGMLDRIDAWIAEGVLGGAEPTVADFQVATSLALIMTHEDLRPAIAARPAGELSGRIAPGFPGRVPPVFPPPWLEPLRAGA